MGDREVSVSSLLREASPDARAAPVPEWQREVGVDGGGSSVAPVPPLGDEVVGAVKVLGKAAGHLCEDHFKMFWITGLIFHLFYLILGDEDRPFRHLVTTELPVHWQNSPRADRHRIQPQRFLQSQLAKPCVSHSSSVDVVQPNKI